MAVTVFATSQSCDAQEVPSPPSRRVKVKPDIVYGKPDEPMHRADLYIPEDSSESLLPGVIMIHGGAWSAGDKGHDRLHARRLAARGYVVMAINYRLAPAHKYPSQLEDCRLALKWLHEHHRDNRIDLERIATWGYSAGGQLAAIMALQPDSQLPTIRAGVCGGTPCDLTMLPPNTKMLDQVFGATPSQSPELYRDASPITFVTSSSPPIFLFHGDKDWLVPQRNSQLMKDRLQMLGVAHEFLSVDGKGHLATFADLSAADKSFEFLDKHLKP
jgi:acetyl esterase/lipase